MAKKANTKKKSSSPRKKKAGASAIPRAGPPVAAAAAAAPGLAPVINQIIALAGTSPIASYNWKKRGQAPAGYVKGMAVAFGRVYCKLLAGDAAAAEMAKADTQKPFVDALSWYAPEFRTLGWTNSVAGADTLRHLFVLLIGLGMRESSGQYCDGRDKDASNFDGETAEAGLFQVSYNARRISPLLPPLLATYQASPSGFIDIFKEGVKCSAAMLKNWGTGTGKDFQQFTKQCPAFAVEFAAVALRNERSHWGPIKRKEAEVIRDCDTLLRGVQDIVNATEGACAALQ